MITQIETFKAEISLNIPFPTSYGKNYLTEHVFVEAVDSTGVVGYGEGTALPEFTGETASSMKETIDGLFAKALRGLDVSDAIRAFREISDKIEGNPGAKAAVEIALLDLYCKTCNIPFYKLFGFKVRSEIDIIYAIGAVPPKHAVKYALHGLRKGFKFFKLKANGNVEEDIERIRSVLDILKQDCKLRVDANCGWRNFEKASKVINKLEANKLVEYVEQPVKRDNLSDLKKLSAEFNTPIFADESVHSPVDAVNLLVNEIVDGLCLKMAKAGGPTKIKLMADVAEEFRKNVTLISAFGTTLDEMVWINVACVTPNLEGAIEIGSWILTENPVKPSLEETCKVEVKDAVGLGVTLNKHQMRG